MEKSEDFIEGVKKRLPIRTRIEIKSVKLLFHLIKHIKTYVVTTLILFFVTATYFYAKNNFDNTVINVYEKRFYVHIIFVLFLLLIFSILRIYPALINSMRYNSNLKQSIDKLDRQMTTSTREMKQEATTSNAYSSSLQNKIDRLSNEISKLR